MNAFDSDSDGQLPRWFGDYVLLKRLGRGGMGQVFLARSPGVAGIDRLCVIKTLRSQWTNDREYVARFVDEARVVVQLNHRNICPVFDVGQVHNTYYLAMDLVPGRDVQAVMEACAKAGVALPIDLTLLIVGEILEALDAAHRLRDPDTDAPLHLVHRDVSPHNALISFDGEVKLIDFGLAHSALKQERTEPGVVLGKMAYMSPEQARGDVVDRRADVFAVGVMLYELAAGERYWQGLTMQDIWQVVGQGSHRPARLQQLPPDVRALIEKATAARPADRYATCAEMRAALTAAQLARGVIASSADLRTHMEQLFAGENGADRRERAALMKLPAPGVVAAVAESTRIARAPGAPPAAGGSSSTSTSPPPPVSIAPAGTERRAVVDAPLAAVARATVDVQTVRVPSARSSSPPRPRWAAGVAVLTVLVVGGAVAFVASSGGSGPAVTPVPAMTAVTTATVAPAPVVAVVPVAPPPQAVEPEPAVPAAVEPVKPVEPLEPAAPVVAVEPAPGVGNARPVSRPKPVERPAKPVEPAPAESAPPPRADKPQPAPAPATEPWPDGWPRRVDQKQALLAQRCSHRPCASVLLGVVPATLPAAGVVKLQEDLIACLAACKAASR